MTNKGEDKKPQSIANKQKVLSPTLKENQRYVVYRLIPKDVLGKDVSGDAARSKFGNFAKIHDYIITQCNLTLGVFDGADAGLMGVKYNPQNLCGVIRINSKSLDKLKVCLGMIKSIENINVIVDCKYVSGMLNKAVDEMNR